MMTNFENQFKKQVLIFIKNIKITFLYFEINFPFILMNIE